VNHEPLLCVLLWSVGHTSEGTAMNAMSSRKQSENWISVLRNVLYSTMGWLLMICRRCLSWLVLICLLRMA